MIKQMLVGFEINLYDLSEIKYVFFVLENLLGVAVRSSQIFLRRLDKTIIQSNSF